MGFYLDQFVDEFTIDGVKYQIQYIDEDCYAILRDGENMYGATLTAESVMRHLTGVIASLSYKVQK